MVVIDNKDIITIKNAKKRFGDRIVLDGVCLSIPEKSIFSILGKSGVGKSVLIKCIMNILEIDEGEIWFGNKNITHSQRKGSMGKLIKHFAYLFQDSALFDSMSVQENIEFPLVEALKIKDKDYIAARVAELLEWVNMPHTQKLMPFQLSGGMRKRIAFARTLAMNPKVMLCDEPTTGLDPNTGNTIMKLIQKANKELGITCVIISHNLSSSLEVSNKLAFLDNGKIQVCATRKEFLKDPYPLLQEFIRHTLFSEGDGDL